MPVYRQSGPHGALLVKSVSQIQTWIIEHLTNKSFNQLNNTDQVDLWPFLASSNLVDQLRTRIPAKNHVSEHILGALEICGLPTCPSHFELSDQVVLFIYLTTYIRDKLADTTLLGQYAITEERYTVALLCTSRYILQLPKDQLATVLSAAPSNFSDSMFVAWRIFVWGTGYLPRNTETYFFVLYIYSMIMDHKPIGMIARSARTYLRSVSTRRNSLLIMCP